MFVGHLALGLAARRADDRASLAWFVAAVTLVDLIWPLLMLAGLEHARPDPSNTAFTPLAFDSYPWTHSLFMGVLWGTLLGVLARSARVARSSAWIIGTLVVSHWVFDLVTHRPDLPLSPWSSGRYGFGLWHSLAATFIVEGVIWIGGIALFLAARLARRAGLLVLRVCQHVDLGHGSVFAPSARCTRAGGLRACRLGRDSVVLVD